MKKSDDLVIGRSGDLNGRFTAEAQRRGEESPDTIIQSSGIPNLVILSGGLRVAIETLVATLREIFDENAYERFLKRTQTLRSVESYSVFLKEREAGVAQRPRCC